MLNSDPTLMPHVVGLLRKHGPMTATVITQMIRAKRRSQYPSVRALAFAWAKYPDAHRIERSRPSEKMAYVYRIAGDERPVFHPPYRLRKRLHMESPRPRDIIITDDDDAWMSEQVERARERERMRKLLVGA